MTLFRRRPKKEPSVIAADSALARGEQELERLRKRVERLRKFKAVVTVTTHD